MEERYSMNDYKPLTMSERKLNIEDEMADLELKKSPLISRKQEIELELSNYNSRVRGKFLPPNEYNEICQWQKALSQEKVDLEKKFTEIRNKKIELTKERERIHLKMKTLPDSMTKDTLLELRDKYMAFASDTTRVSSMRAMASKFVEELVSVIKGINNSI